MAEWVLSGLRMCQPPLPTPTPALVAWTFDDVAPPALLVCCKFSILVDPKHVVDS
jgi:hypothetical protein